MPVDRRQQLARTQNSSFCRSTAVETARFPSAFCAQVKKHGGLYFRQLHHEGVNEAIIVEDISESTTTATTNPDPIVFESSVATGTFKDASMKLYLIGNAAFAAPEIAEPRTRHGSLTIYWSGC